MGREHVVGAEDIWVAFSGRQVGRLGWQFLRQEMMLVSDLRQIIPHYTPECLLWSLTLGFVAKISMYLEKHEIWAKQDTREIQEEHDIQTIFQIPARKT